MNVPEFVNLLWLPIAITALVAVLSIVVYVLFQGNKVNKTVATALLDGNGINKEMLGQWKEMTKAYFTDANEMKNITAELRKDISPGLVGVLSTLTQKVDTNSEHLGNVDKKIEANTTHLDKVDRTFNVWRKWFPWLYSE